jgi:uncharacterized membrane protein YphA (DoxX/SURF4 family)
MIPQLQRDELLAAPAETRHWSVPTRIGFRFAFSYFLLYVAPGPVGSLSPYKPANALDNNLANWLWHQIVPWVSANVLRLNPNDIREIPNGSGDQLYDYVLILCLLVTAALATAVWSWLDRKRPNYDVLYRWLRLLMRMTVAWSMLGYGIKKLIGAQFTPPTLSRQLQPFGKATPMGMLWTFMGASQPYSFFGGLGETVGGVLLILPGLTTLGALVSGALMTNVLMLNLFYDVPRKIFSIHLVLMCLFLLLPDFRRLANVMVLNRRAEPVPDVPLFRDKLLNLGAALLPILFGAYVLYAAGTQSVRDLEQLTATVPAPLYGLWKVDELVVDGVVHPPLLTETDRWQTVVFDAPTVFTIQSMDGKQAKYFMQLQNNNQTVKLRNPDDRSWNASLAVQNTDADRMTMEGQFGNRQVSAKMERVNLSDPDQFPLMNRGFHWVNPMVNNPLP